MLGVQSLVFSQYPNPFLLEAEPVQGSGRANVKRRRSADPRSIIDVTARYEGWLRTQTSVVEDDLLRKHELMRESPFPFLRATYYAWAEAWLLALPAESRAPRVTAVGDLHLENFGTWRDAEGRLCWGVNDFDEAATLPYTNDLVRLATSAVLAARTARLRAPARALATAFLDAYRTCLGDGRRGHPIIFAERHRRIGDRVLRKLVRPGEFWKEKLAETDAGPRPVPSACRMALRAALPAGTTNVQIRPRIAGMGSLGRRRFVAIGDWKGGWVAREAKAIVPSAAVWAGVAGPAPPSGGAFARLLEASVRSRDPFLHTSHAFVVRRLAPDVGKIDIVSLGQARELQLAALMGRELANVHLATPGATAAIMADLDARPRGWLLEAARAMADLTTDTQEVWRKAGKKKGGLARRRP